MDAKGLDVPSPDRSTCAEDDSSASFTHELIFLPIPKRLRYDPQKAFHFGLLMNLSLGFASTVTVANLNYCQPLLIDLAQDFGVSYSKVSRVPTLLQAGYAAGVILISPLGDLVRRRQLILLCLILSTAFTVGLSVTDSFIVFEALSFLVGVTSIITSIMQPLAADLAPPERRATAVSVVISGLLLGVLLARVLAGVLGQFASWRTAYYFGVGAQVFALVWLYLIIPDYPAKNAGTGLTYWGILWTMARFAVTEPALIQSCLVNFMMSAGFTSFWVTLTFLLGGPLYNYSTLDIGLFGLVGILGVLLGPLMGRLIDHLVPWYATLFAVVLLGVFNAVQMGAGGLSVAAVLVVAFGLNLFRQLVQASLATIVLSISAEARGRLNAVNVLSIFLGQVMGTPVGSQIYLQHGWRACAALSVGLSGAQIVVLLLRGPHCGRYAWVGWEGGWGARRRKGDAEKPGENSIREEVAPSDPEKAPETINIVGADEGEGGGGEAPRREDVNSVSASEQPEPQKR
ncbi:major facilitator superfamily domain-containing protein [Mycena albidolilacea]|uniref:Major facilitator superfamily domain-containing protein n=1 Tax=Mycena albidolilacea TaxID=1033008 RepID=A0AAD6Z903_9AGAR|nr:major facilitator superfamily domain-containing protein [Mycena albidolilacea]